MRSSAGLAILLVGAAGCLPYTVGSTPATAPEGEVQAGASIYYLPAGIETLDSSRAISLVGVDLEGRFGLDERSDVGVRLVSLLTGAVVSYKRLLTPTDGYSPLAASVMLGTGIVNGGDHVLFQGTLLLGKGREDGPLTPYGGLHAMQVIPTVEQAVSDAPTLGAFVGVRIGDRDLGVSPEVSVFWDRSALDLRERDWIAVFSMTLHGERLIGALLGRR